MADNPSQRTLSCKLNYILSGEQVRGGEYVQYFFFDPPPRVILKNAI